MTQDTRSIYHFGWYRIRHKTPLGCTANYSVSKHRQLYVSAREINFHATNLAVIERGDKKIEVALNAKETNVGSMPLQNKRRPRRAASFRTA